MRFNRLKIWFRLYYSNNQNYRFILFINSISLFWIVSWKLGVQITPFILLLIFYFFILFNKYNPNINILNNIKKDILLILTIISYINMYCIVDLCKDMWWLNNNIYAMLLHYLIFALCFISIFILLLIKQKYILIFNYVISLFLFFVVMNFEVWLVYNVSHSWDKNEIWHDLSIMLFLINHNNLIYKLLLIKLDKLSFIFNIILINIYIITFLFYTSTFFIKPFIYLGFLWFYFYFLIKEYNIKKKKVTKEMQINFLYIIYISFFLVIFSPSNFLKYISFFFFILFLYYLFFFPTDRLNIKKIYIIIKKLLFIFILLFLFLWLYFNMDIFLFSLIIFLFLFLWV